MSSLRSITDATKLEQWNSLESRSALLNSLLIPKNRENPPSPNELLSKAARIADIRASVEASDKTAVCIVLKQRSNSGYYGKLCYLGKQMAVVSDKSAQASEGFASKNVSVQYVPFKFYSLMG